MVNNDILFGKFEYYGIRGTACNWFKSNLNKRTQITKIDSFYSKYSAVNCEVPQGSVLDPFPVLVRV